MKTAVIYARYSSDAQTEQSIEGQLRVCQKYAQDHDILILDTYIDRAMTGTNDNRLDFQRMLKDSAKRQWDYVIVYKLDRFSRNKYESVIHKKTLKDNGVKLLSAMEQIPDSPEGTLMEALLEGFNQYYSEELAQKVNRGLRESWLKGNATGGNDTFGYDMINKKYVINEYEAEIVKEIFIKYAQGFKAVAIAEDLKVRGVKRKNGKLLDIKYIYYILHNEKYTGRVERNGVVYDNIFPRIISDELWIAVKSITEENKHAPSRKKEIFDYILSGKLICGDCKCPMSGESGTSHTGQSHYYYLCRSRRRKKAPCKTKAITKQYLEDTVIDATMAVIASDEIIELIAETVYKIHEKETNDNTVLKSLIKKRKEVQRKSDNIIKAIEMGIITEQTKTRLKELEQELLQIDFDIDREKQRTYTFLAVNDIKAFLKDKMFEDTKSIKIRKLIVNTFIREIIYYPDKLIITYNFSDVIDTIKLTSENAKEIERQSKSAFSLNIGSAIFSNSSPRKEIGTPKWVPISFFVLRTKPNPLARAVKCRFAEMLFAQGVRIPRVQSTTRYCGSTEIYQEISTDLEIISSLSTRAPHSPSAFVSHIIGSASLRGSNTLASICSQRGTSLHEKQLSTVFPSLSVLVWRSGHYWYYLHLQY